MGLGAHHLVARGAIGQLARFRIVLSDGVEGGQEELGGLLRECFGKTREEARREIDE
jgi:hypothetical protein